MKRNKLYQCVLGAVLALLPLAYQANAATVDDPAVMDRISHSRMLPITMSNPLDSGTLLFSDSPEYADKDGILYGDEVNGDCRLYFYHVNQSNLPKKIVVMAYNPTEEPAEVIIKGCQYARPSQSYYDVGKELSTMYYEGLNTVNKVLVQPHNYALLGERLDKVVVQPADLFSGIVDFSLPTSMYVSSVIMPVAVDPQVFIRRQIYLPSDSVQLRGTFRGMNRDLHNLVSFTPADGIGYVKIADGLVDRFLEGRDVMDNRISENTGNYGVDYSVRLRTKGQGNLHLYFNPQGGEYAGVAEVIYPDGRNGDGKNIDDKKIVELPRNRLSMGYNDPYAMEYIDSFKAGSTVIVHLMPPGAANLPIRLLVVPDQQLEQAAKEAAELQKLKDSARNMSTPDWLHNGSSANTIGTTAVISAAPQQQAEQTKNSKKKKQKKNDSDADTEHTYTPWHPKTVI
ncbi:MAG: hypothetical protein LKF74_08055 [Megasphaera sp.]|jgi:hypothetical protein|nr:hypothetical protein [Megasphaera sp.]MCH4218491.1 hypothetical protein [Megasphaera sp.]